MKAIFSFAGKILLLAFEVAVLVLGIIGLLSIIFGG